jgi:S-methylmethionine-dependent homocysteine/selenocysteine methylase
LGDLPVSGVLANCCAPESITSAIPELVETGLQCKGGYANTFQPVPQDWKIDGDKQTDGMLDLLPDLDPDRYAAHAAEWLKKGATVVGGCCAEPGLHILPA